MKKIKFFWYHFLRVLGTPLFKLYFNIKVIGKDVIPKKGPVIFCGNHLNFFDQFPVIMSTSRTIHWLSKKEYFEGRFRNFFKAVGCIRVDRESHDGKAKKEALEYLKKGSAIGLFPEGTRNRTDKELLEFKKGAVKMAKESGAIIIPFAINGDFKFRSKNLILRFGSCFTVGSEDDIGEANEKLRNTILKLQRKNKDG